jgi:glutamate carboxypeptidase
MMDVLNWLAEQQGPMLALLEDLVNIDSNSYDKKGVDRVVARLEAFFEVHGVSTERISNERFGDACEARVGNTQRKPILLLGHCDTVFPRDETSRRPFRRAGPYALGPGVCDMKAGLVLNAFMLVAFRKFDAGELPLVALFTSDEEIASPACRPIIERIAQQARAALNSEAGRPSGNVITGRKGGRFMRVGVKGVAAHSGVNFSEGRSAVSELARKIAAFDAITDLDRGTTVNVGLINGGQSVNTVAPQAAAELDFRYVSSEERDAGMARIMEVVTASSIEGTTANLELLGEFCPLVQDDRSKSLFEAYANSAREIGLSVSGEYSGGCADSGFSSSVGCPTLCGVGPIGAKGHSADEYMVIESFVPRALVMAATIGRL